MGRCPASLSWPIRESYNLGEGPAPIRVAVICRVSIRSYSDETAAALLGAAVGWTGRLEQAGSLSDTSRMGADAGTRIRDEGPPEATISSSTPSSSTITDGGMGSPSAPTMTEALGPGYIRTKYWIVSISADYPEQACGLCTASMSCPTDECSGPLTTSLPPTETNCSYIVACLPPLLSHPLSPSEVTAT
jgi:hypothetical protein